MEIDRIKFDPTDDSSKNWKKLLNFNKIIHQRLYPKETRISDEENKKQIIRQFKQDDIIFDLYLIFEKDKEEMIALFMIGAMNEHIGITDIIVLPEYRKKGIAKLLLNDLYDSMAEKGIEHIISNSQEEEGKDLVEKMGGKVLESNIENRVYFEDIDWKLMNNWIKEGEEKNSDIKLQVYSKVPDELMKIYIAMQNEMLDYFPKDNLSLNEAMITEDMIRAKEEELSFSGKTKVTAVLMDENKIVSLSEMIFSQSHIDRIYQGLTYTLDKYTKKGLTKWIKAYMLNFVRDNYSTVKFVNSNLISKDPALMLINQRIGYNLVKRYYTLEISTKDLGIYVNETFISLL